MRFSSVILAVVLCLAFLSAVPTLAGTCAACPNGFCPLPVAGPSCMDHREHGSVLLLRRSPLIKMVPSVKPAESAPTFAPRRNLVKKIARPIKTIREGRKVRGRWATRCGRRGPRRLVARMQMRRHSR